MEFGGILNQLKNRTILITGSTGFLGKIFVEKVLRVQPQVTKLFLLVRGTETETALQRVQREIIRTELFNILREKHGEEFHSFISEKVHPIDGDIACENLGIEDSHFREALWGKIHIVVNVAAITNFFERYDVALATNVLGAKKVMEFARKCQKIEVLLHVSTAYVAGMRKGIVREKLLHLGDTLKPGITLDIEAELKLVEERKKELSSTKSMNTEHIAMKELGFQRARNFGWPNTYVFTKAMGEMLLGHSRGNLPLVIVRPTIVTSIIKEPLPGWIEGTRTIDMFIEAFAKGKLAYVFGDFSQIADVVLKLTNVICFQSLSRQYQELDRKHKSYVQLFDLYSPYLFFEGRFDDTNMERLRIAMEKDNDEAMMFNFDPRCIDWNQYFINTHIPSLMRSIYKRDQAK